MSHLIHIIDELRVGGAQTNLLVLLRNTIKSENIRQTVVCLFGPGEMEKDIRALGAEVKIFDFRNEVRSHNLISPIIELKNFFLEIEPTHVLAHLTWSRFLGLPSAWLADVPNRFGFEHGDFYLDGIFFKIGNFISQFFCKKIFVCSRFMGEWFSTHRWVCAKKIKVVYLGIDPKEFTMGNAPFLGGTFLFCAVGTLGRGVNKRFDIIISAISQLNRQGIDVGLAICGDGEQRPELESLAFRLGAGDKVKFLGLRRDVGHVMSGCHAFCHSAPFEPFGLVVIEAMLVGLPVVVPEHGGPSEITEGNSFGLTYKNLDAADLASKMKVIIEDKEMRHSLVARGRQRVMEKFLVDRYAQELFATMNLGD